jgi:hypothetical protein
MPAVCAGAATTASLHGLAVPDSLLCPSLTAAHLVLGVDQLLHSSQAERWVLQLQLQA